MTTRKEAVKVIEASLLWLERKRGAEVPFTNDTSAIADRL
jgi:hypothetical protein